MTVGDKGRSFKDDMGADVDETTFKEREGDYTTSGGGDNVARAGGYVQPKTGAYVPVKAAPVIRADAPSLGDAANALARRKKAEGR
jgi:hypothetical protein